MPRPLLSLCLLTAPAALTMLVCRHMICRLITAAAGGGRGLAAVVLPSADAALKLPGDAEPGLAHCHNPRCHRGLTRPSPGCQLVQLTASRCYVLVCSMSSATPHPGWPWSRPSPTSSFSSPQFGPYNSRQPFSGKLN